MESTRSVSQPLDDWPHQLRELERYRDSPARALLWGMRTGKTRPVVRTAFHLHRYLEVDGLLVLAPNGVHQNWIRHELPKHAEDRWIGCAWSSSLSETTGFKERLRRVLRPDRSVLRVLAVNSEALQLKRVQAVVREFLASCGGRVMLVADECHDFRRPGTTKTRLARALAKRLTYKRILSGTSVLNSPRHAFSQFELLKPGALGFPTMEDFDKRHVVYGKRRLASGRTFPQIEGYAHLDELREKIGAWSSVVMREEAELPPLVSVTRPVVMSAAQVGAYRQMVDEHLLDFAEGKLEAIEGGIRAMKLQQIIGGWVIRNDMETGDTVISIDDQPPILDAMLEQVEGTLPGKSIVWCRFQEDIRRVCAKLAKAGIGYVELHGKVGASRREEAKDRFQTDHRVTTLVGQPQAGGSGIDLSAADAVVWYSTTPDAIVYRQACERGTAKGMSSVALVRLATHGTIDDGIYDILEERATLADTLSGTGLRDLLLRTEV